MEGAEGRKGGRSVSLRALRRTELKSDSDSGVVKVKPLIHIYRN